MKKRDLTGVMEDAGAFRQHVRMVAAQVTGLRPEELSVALAYEVEPLSGIPAAEAEVEFRPMPDADATVRVFEVAVRRRGKKAAGNKASERFVKPTIFFGVLLGVLVVGDCGWQMHRQAAVSRKVAVQGPLDTQLKGVRARAGAVRDEIARLRAAREAAARIQDRVDELRAVYPQVLDEVAKAFVARAVLKDLSGDVQAIHLGAIAISSQAAADALSDLSRALEGHGWKVVTGAVAADRQGLTTFFDCEVTHD